MQLVFGWAKPECGHPSPLCVSCGSYGYRHVTDTAELVQLCLLCADVYSHRTGVALAPWGEKARAQYRARAALAVAQVFTFTFTERELCALADACAAAGDAGGVGVFGPDVFRVLESRIDDRLQW